MCSRGSVAALLRRHARLRYLALAAVTMATKVQPFCWTLFTDCCCCCFVNSAWDCASTFILFVLLSGFACMVGFGSFFARWAAVDPRGIAVARFLKSQNDWTASGLARWNTAALLLGAPTNIPVSMSFMALPYQPFIASGTTYNVSLPPSTLSSGLDGVAANYVGGWAGPGVWSNAAASELVWSTMTATSDSVALFSIPTAGFPSLTPVSLPLFKCTNFRKAPGIGTAPSPPGGVQTKLLTTGGSRRSLLYTSTSRSRQEERILTVSRLSNVALVATLPANCSAGACAPTSLSIDTCATTWSTVYQFVSPKAAKCGDSSLSGLNMVGATISVTLRLDGDPVVIGGRLTTCRGYFGLTKQQLSTSAICLFVFSAGLPVFCCLVVVLGCCYSSCSDNCHACCCCEHKTIPAAPEAVDTEFSAGAAAAADAPDPVSDVAPADVAPADVAPAGAELKADSVIVVDPTRVIPCVKIFWHGHMLGLPSDTLAWPHMAPLNDMPVEHRVCSVCLQGDNHETHEGTKWRCTEGCNFDACESCGAMEHWSIDNVASVTFSDGQHWCHKCFARVPWLGCAFECLFSTLASLIGVFCVLPCKLLCCIEQSVCHCLFGERLDHDAAEQTKKETEERLAAQRAAKANEASALGVSQNDAAATAEEMLAAPKPMTLAPPTPTMSFVAPPIPAIMRPLIPEAYHRPYGGTPTLGAGPGAGSGAGRGRGAGPGRGAGRGP